MEVQPTRRTDPWMWVAIVAIAALLVLLVVWLVAARSPETEEEAALPPAQEDRQPTEQAQEDGDRVVIRDRERVREVVRERPVYVYVERPDADDETQTPREVVVVPRESQQPDDHYQRIDLPARFEYEGREWIIRPGQPVRAANDDYVSTGRQIEGRTIYSRRGAAEPPQTLYLRIRSDSNIYVSYEAAER